MRICRRPSKASSRHHKLAGAIKAVMIKAVIIKTVIIKTVIIRKSGETERQVFRLAAFRSSPR
jgi:hypothetical protein